MHQRRRPGGPRHAGLRQQQGGAGAPGRDGREDPQRHRVRAQSGLQRGIQTSRSRPGAVQPDPRGLRQTCAQRKASRL